jgi:transcriptional regulator with XRE-family HTH domain
MFGQYIKQLRESRSLSLADAARLLGVTPQKLWDMENGRRHTKKVPRPLITAIARTYRVPIGVIAEATKIKIAEKQVLSEHLADTRPLVTRAVRLTAALVNEARAYTPELEQDAIKLYDLLQDLKTRIDNAYFSLYPNTQKAGGD